MSKTAAKQVIPTLKVTTSSRVMNQSGSGTLRIDRSTTIRRSINASVSRRSFSLARGSKVLDKASIQTHKHSVQVFDETGKNVTPQPLYQLEAGATQTKQSKILTGPETAEGTVSDFLSTAHYTMSASSAGPFTMSVIGSSSVSKSSQSLMESESDEIKAPSAKQEPLISVSELKPKTEEQIEEPLLDDLVDIYLTETEIMCFLDIPGVAISVDSNEAEAINKRNKAYTEICKNRQGNDRYMEREMQTINAASKSKEVQSDCIIMVEKGSMATTWDIYDMSVCNSWALETDRDPDEEKPSISHVSTTHHLESNRDLESTMSLVSASSTASTSSSQIEVRASTAHMVDESDPEEILYSERFQQSLQAMERMVLLNIYQHKLAAYRGLPILPDPDCVPNLGVEDREEVKEEDSPSPALELLWTFSCELTKGLSVSSMSWNKKNRNILAVGYGQSDFKDQKSGLVCIWSLKNPTWPERMFNCITSVISLDFSASNPNQLAVGLYDGTIAIYNVQSTKGTLVCDSRDCAQKHTAPVWQVKWIDRIQDPSGEDQRETLFSVSADARISEWFLHQDLDYAADRMKLKRIRNEKTEQLWKHEPLISHWAVGLCFDFDRYDPNMYLVGTEEGHIHECSCSYNDQFLETYTSHLGPVYKVKWSPFCQDIFLSCSADWTIQLWHQDHFTPVLSFTSVKTAVYDIMWSPRWATVFAAVNKDRVEIWDLGASIINPTLVSEAIPGVKPTTLLFAKKTDCVLVGDSEGQVRVYKLKNFTAGQGTQEDTLNDIVNSTLARQL